MLFINFKIYNLYNKTIQFRPPGAKIRGTMNRKTGQAWSGQEIKRTQGPSGV